MWQMIAEPGLRCSECRHVIQTGRLCLSELPEEKPPGLFRSDFRNYCIGCPKCWSQGKHACYVRHLDRGNSVARTPRSLPCAYCGRRIAAGEKAGVDIYYEWPDATADGNVPSAARILNGAGGVAAAVGTDIWIRGVPSNSWESLSNSLQSKLASAGGVDRSAAEARAFYQESIPYPVHNLGEDAVWKFTEGKDASHIQSVHNAPDLAADNSNILWESSEINRARGAENMTGSEQLRAQATNAFDSTGIVLRDCMQTAGIAALYAGLLETPVAAMENYLHYKRGRMTGEEAVKEAATAIAKRAAAGAVVGFTVTAAVALIGAGPLLVTIAPVLMPVGLALYGYNALKRIMDAYAYGPHLHNNLPVKPVGTYFCNSRCHAKFSWETGYSALMRWEADRVTG